MLPSRPSLRGTQWGEFWFVGKPTGSPARLYETMGAAFLPQLQIMLRDGLSASDITFDGTRVGDRVFAIDGIWGPETMRRFWAYANKVGRGASPVAEVSRAELDAIAGFARTRSGAQLERIVKTALKLLYFSNRKLADGSVVNMRPDQVLLDRHLQVATIADTLPTQMPVRVLPRDAYFARPTETVFDQSIPVTGSLSVDEWRVQSGGPQTRISGPWTIAEGRRAPVVLDTVLASTPTFVPDRPATTAIATTPTRTPPREADPRPQVPVKDVATPVPVDVGSQPPAPAERESSLRSFTRWTSGLATSVGSSPYAVPALATLGIASGVLLIAAGFRLQAQMQASKAKELEPVKLPPNIRITTR